MVGAGGLNPPDPQGSCGFESRPGHPGWFTEMATVSLIGTHVYVVPSSTLDAIADIP